MRFSTVLAVSLLLAACKGDKPSAMAVCQKIQAAGLGSNCREAKPNGLGANAAERADFDLPAVPGKGAGVMRFEREDLYDGTVKAFEGAAALAGPHRYGSRKALIFVQANEGLSLEDGRRLKAFVDAL